jgi:hypothetical protein
MSAVVDYNSIMFVDLESSTGFFEVVQILFRPALLWE